ncbi:MAG TPA: hypothetical protein VN513_06225 [Gemmatimonadales bacterium]|nr:hypothetical protein [Gemmatimonadales bacterium]
MRRAARVDATQAAIVDAFRRYGASVDVIGLPVDLAVGYRGRTVLVEVKTQTGKLKPSQQAWLDAYRGAACVVRSEAEAVALVRQMGRDHGGE